MSEPINRRSAILRMLGMFSSTNLLAWDALPSEKIHWSVSPTNIVPGERFGNVFLEMQKPDVLHCLGLPCKTINFEAENLERTLKVFEYINAMTGRNLTAKDAFPLRQATTYLNYDRLGLSVCLTNGRVSAIHASTGVLSGYDDPAKLNFPTNRVPLGATLLETTKDIQSHWGKPDNLTDNPYAPIPEIDLSYCQGVSFVCRADDTRLARIIVLKRKNS